MLFDASRPKLVVRIDAPNLEPLEPILDELEDLPIWIAVGWPLVVGVGPTLVHHMRHCGFETVFDLRLSDTPARAAMVAETIARSGARALTVDLTMGMDALQACRRALRGRVSLVGVCPPDGVSGLGAVGGAAVGLDTTIAVVDGLWGPMGAWPPTEHGKERWIEVSLREGIPSLAGLGKDSTTFVADLATLDPDAPRVDVERLLAQIGDLP